MAKRGVPPGRGRGRGRGKLCYNIIFPSQLHIYTQFCQASVWIRLRWKPDPDLERAKISVWGGGRTILMTKSISFSKPQVEEPPTEAPSLNRWAGGAAPGSSFSNKKRKNGRKRRRKKGSDYMPL